MGPMFPVSLDCLSSYCVLCDQCSPCVWIVCLRTVSNVTNVPRVSGLFVFVLCLMCPMFPVSLDCLFNKQSRDTGNIGHIRHSTKTNNPETRGTLVTQDTVRKQTIKFSYCVLCDQCSPCLWIVCFRTVSCVTNVPRVSGLFVFVLCLM
jgi:hypothetical protein